MTAHDDPQPLTLEWLQEDGAVVAQLGAERFSGQDVRDIHANVVSAAARRAADSPDGALTVVVRGGGAEQGRWRITRHGTVTPMPGADSAAAADSTSGSAIHDGPRTGPAAVPSVDDVAVLGRESRRTRRGAAVSTQPGRRRGLRTRPRRSTDGRSTEGRSTEGRSTEGRSTDDKAGRLVRQTGRMGRLTARLGRLSEPSSRLGGRVFGRGGPGRLGRFVLVVTVLCIGLALALGGWSLLRETGTIGPSTVRGERMAATAPLEWSADSVWRTPALLPEAGRVLVTENAVAFVTTDRRIVLVDAVSGQTRWSGSYPAGDPRTDLTVSSIDHREVVAAQVGERLAWWDLSTGESGGLDLPSGSVVVLRGTAPLVASADGKTAALVRQGRLVTGELPDKSTALAGRSDGVITAASPAGWWHLTPGQPPAAPRAWEVPGGSGMPAVVAYLGGSLITMLRIGENSAPQILVFSDREHDVRFAWIGPGVFEEPSATWHPSPSRHWGILGRTLVDLDAGRATDLGRWTTQLVSADRALGDLAGERVLAGPDIPLGSLQQGESFPEDLTDAGALVRARVGEGEVVYLLPPKEQP